MEHPIEDSGKSGRPTVHCLFCGEPFLDGIEGTCTVAIYKPPDEGVWYGAHDACLRSAAHPSAPLSTLPPP